MSITPPLRPAYADIAAYTADLDVRHALHHAAQHTNALRRFTSADDRIVCVFGGTDPAAAAVAFTAEAITIVPAGWTLSTEGR
ncbi:hypothetical protein [Planomonospora algeriensis]